MKTICAAALVVMVGMAAGCRRQDIRVARIHVPQMQSQLCADRIVAVAQAIPGVQRDRVTVDHDRRDITVPYDSLLLSLKNIEFKLAEAGFQANDIPADATARAALPEGCR